MNKCIRTYSHDVQLVAQRRKEIYMTAAKLFLKKGYQGTSMRALSKAVGLSVAGLYHYIGTKDDIIYMIMEYTVDDYEAKLLKHMKETTVSLEPREALCEAIRLYFESIDEVQDIHNLHNHIIASQPREYREMLFEGQRKFVSVFREIIDRGIEQGIFHSESSELIAHNILLNGQGWANRRWFLRHKFTLAEYIRLETEQTLRSLQPGDAGNKNGSPVKVSRRRAQPVEKVSQVLLKD